MDLDRETPALRDACRTRSTGRQTWQELLFLHYEVPVDALRALLPKAVEVDTFEGRAYLGLVPFTMHDVRIGPLPVSDFLETNLRTYVHANGVPGVWFFSLGAQSRFAVMGARAVYRLPYYRAEMSSQTEGAKTEYKLRRFSKDKPADLDVRWSLSEGEPYHAEPGTLDHFLTERYCLYGPKGADGAYRLRVHYHRWPLQAARVEHLHTTLPQAAGLQVKEPIELVLASPYGVAVETFAAEQL